MGADANGLGWDWCAWRLGRFRQGLAARGLSPRTRSSYSLHAGQFARWLAGTYGRWPSPGEATALDVADYRRWLQDRGRKPATVNQALKALSAYFRWAAAEGLASGNPAEGVKAVPEQRPGPRWLGRRELGLLAAAVQRHGSPRDCALFALLLHAGLRISEACSLRVADVELRERSGLVVVRAGKGGKRRELPLNATARRALGEWLSAHPGGEWLFVSRKGSRLSVRAAERAIAKYARLAGLEGVTPHALRHTFCKMLVDAGESLDRVAALAGHANLNTTARYTRPSLQDLERAVDRIAWE